MRALLQDTLTRKFVGGWTEARAQATEFASALEAIKYADDHKLQGLVVLSADGKPPLGLLPFRDDCRAARIGDVTAFAQCLVEIDRGCRHRFSLAPNHFCEHPQREAIIARALATETPPAPSLEI